MKRMIFNPVLLNFKNMLKRAFSVNSSNYVKHSLNNKLKVRAWQTHEYGDLKNVQLDEVRIPVIRKPTDVLVQVNSASVNPIDILMLGGYGKTLMQVPRNWELELPLIVGRDFCGTIIGKGQSVCNDYKVGDEVYGFVPLYNSGTFSEAIITDVSYLLPKPKHLTHFESASMVYATMTAWSALYVFGNMLSKQKKGLRVLILGASGGVGTAAIQILKSQQCHVFATCSEDAIPLVTELGADNVFNYKDQDFEQKIEQEGRYHIILDGARMGHQNIPKGWKFDTYISLNSPLLKNTDQYGLLPGLAYSLSDVLESNLKRFKDGSSIVWGFFVPSRNGFEFINELITDKKIKPIIHKKFSFDQLPEALQTVADGHLRGKVVIDYQ
ncbi:reticulon-4-interacting protein 1, mitochondrial [Diorhabda carinulata]|uniref:reticulon-4-interacting protein 1, mitochondrial n=1 Tax=Diorhabda carinulata TaxID=1163345 RepID=UPI0025A0634B|nr:reticulon-4-interacting protein 1, mitochondrial [Diorhabda carinulata]